METVELQIGVRPETNKADLRRVRREGNIPAVAYSEGEGSVPIEIDSHHYSVQTAGKSVTQIYSLKSDSKDLNEQLVLIKDVQREALSGKVQHVDFYRVTTGTMISVVVPVRLEGVCEAVKTGAAILNQTTWEVDVECLPRQIPSELVVDISNLEEGDSISLGQIPLPEGVQLKSESSISLVSALAKRGEAAADEEAEDAEGEGEVKAEGEEAAKPASE